MRRRRARTRERRRKKSRRSDRSARSLRNDSWRQDSLLQIRLVVGLGNPGPEYDRTRHNVGFNVVDLLASEWGLTWQHSKSWHALWAKGEKAILVKPASYMNRSGEPLSADRQLLQDRPG